tara:strand:+ start:1167 stop:1397 length:231 start_codon:yes stop_codon:yes gene_type:complete
MTTNEDTWVTVVRVPRNATQEILVRTGTYWNKEVIDIRLYSDGNPTRKGIRFNTDELINITKALVKISEMNNNDNE